MPSRRSLTPSSLDGSLPNQGCIPHPPPPPVSAGPIAAPEPVTECSFKKPRGRVKCLEGQVSTKFMQVVHLNLGRVHVWTFGLYSVCRKWRCGTPEGPTELAVFHHDGDVISDTTWTPFCKSCYSERLGFLGVGETADPRTRFPHYIRAALDPRSSASGAGAIANHFCEDGHSIDDLCITLVDAVPTNKRFAVVYWCVRKRLENRWIHRLGATLNVRRNWRSFFPGAGQRSLSTQ